VKPVDAVDEETGSTRGELVKAVNAADGESGPPVTTGPTTQGRAHDAEPAQPADSSAPVHPRMRFITSSATSDSTATT
jgi:hypothetical protein